MQFRHLGLSRKIKQFRWIGFVFFFLSSCTDDEDFFGYGYPMSNALVSGYNMTDAQGNQLRRIGNPNEQESCDNGDMMFLYPNPSTSSSTLMFQNMGDDKTIKLTIVGAAMGEFGSTYSPLIIENVVGEVYVATEYFVENGNNFVLILPNVLPSGAFRIYIDNGDCILTKNLIKT